MSGGAPMIDRRALLAGAAATMAGVAAPAIAASRQSWDAVVAKSGAPGTLPTLAAALELAARAGRPFRILLEEGVYREKLTVAVPDVTIAGRGPRSVIAFDAANRLPRPEGGSWGTAGSATLTITAPGTTLTNLSVRNDFDYLAAKRNAAGDGVQAVALLIDRAADRTHLDRCTLESYQDTLYVQARSLIERCRIAGVVDFIFGGAAAVFDRCDIVTRLVPGAELHGYIAAPSTPHDQRFGLIFERCRLLREKGVPDGSAWLGRPWRAGGNMDLTGQAVFLRCWMDAHIQHAGWTWMGYRGPTGDQRRLTPPEARLLEYGSTGPGSGPAGDDRRLLTRDQAAAFTRANVLGGWAGG